MLSILIPVYNFDVSELVNKLHQQGKLLSIPFEIILVDDASNDSLSIEKNKKLATLEFVVLEFLSQNMGRARIRNYLAEQAQYDYLLYMDCDSMPPDADFLKRYIVELNPTKLLYGGRIYQKEQPANADLILHWYYGTNREVVIAEKRREQPYDSFMTNNFLIPKAILLAIKFDERLTEYGHEDTLFGIELKKRKIEIIHLDNPLVHIGIESSVSFLAKTEKGIKNLYYLHQQYDLGKGIKLLNYFIWLDKFRLAGLYLLVYHLFAKKIVHNLHSTKPNLRFFDLFKLAKLIEQKKASSNK